MNTSAENIRNRLLELKDEKYKEFNSKLIPNVDKDQIIGIRSPILRNFAKSLSQQEIDDFLSTLPHKYMEENILHSMLISKISDYNECIDKLNEFLTYCGSWAEIDCISPKKAFKGHNEDLKKQAFIWQESNHEFTVRYGIKVFMDFFLDNNFNPKDAEKIAKINSDKMYINLMIAWYFATALAKQYDAVIAFFEVPCMNKWVHNKAIQKAIESFRVTDEHKAYLRTLKI